MEAIIPQEHLWMVIIGFLVAFILAFGLGANDVANSFGTSVGSGVLTLRSACILATIFETLGAVLIGYRVSDTIRKGIIDVSGYQNQSELLMIGQVSALTGSCVWLLAATALKLPVSGTHSIVGATIGFALVAKGVSGINWGRMGLIIASWFISPLSSGLVSTLLFFVIKHFILTKESQLEIGLRCLPVFYGCTLVINLFSVFYEGSNLLGFDRIPLWGVFILSFGGGIVSALLVRFLMVPWQRRKIKNELLNEATDEIKDSEKGQYTKSEGIDPKMLTLPDKITAAAYELEIQNKENIEKIQNGGYQTLSNGTNNNNNLELPPESKLQNGFLATKEKSDPHHGAESLEMKKRTFLDVESKDVSPNGTAPPSGYATPLSTKALIDSADLESEDGNKGRDLIHDRPETAKLFAGLQVLTAIFGSFAHGGNDVSNAIGPLVGLWIIATTGDVGQKAQTPIWILLYGGVGISVGLWILGRRVIKTIGEDLTKITPSSGFCIEVGSALTVLIASNIGIPISTTHCKVGSIVFVGRFRSKENIDWSLFRNIVIAWLVTLPISGGISAAMMAGLRLTIQQ